MNTTTLKTPSSEQPPIPWWRVPHMWLVVGGPLVVVVAAIITAVIAVEGADPVLNKADFERDLKAAQTLDGQARTEALIKLQPAHQARNHAASPVVPLTKE
ncbi:MAG: nitrogen fixation protein FixH [Betaproteobacteria bacterium HGW-Betaproteobacteria-9]|jgi:hypothetical protein|nr:nitrogen fixation protein FixH [Hydrogenophaga sp.]PKO26952.1 MAG: nitrogen fixation protein FixH [Betaproteobacteria bacterium HGW-Betaproteobacteria-9]